MYKVVDYSNGRQSKNVHETEEKAFEELQKDKVEFENSMINRNTIYCKKVVSADKTYRHNGFDWVWM